VLLKIGLLIDRGHSQVNCRPLNILHYLDPTPCFLALRFFDFAHRDLAALLAISLRRSADNFFIRAFADFRPIAEKYSDSLLSITGALYMLNGLAWRVKNAKTRSMATIIVPRSSCPPLLCHFDLVRSVSQSSQVSDWGST
jgi:hypothetical protein